jgi:hypothetical protein
MFSEEEKESLLSVISNTLTFLTIFGAMVRSMLMSVVLSIKSVMLRTG